MIPLSYPDALIKLLLNHEKASLNVTLTTSFHCSADGSSDMQTPHNSSGTARSSSSETSSSFDFFPPNPICHSTAAADAIPPNGASSTLTSPSLSQQQRRCVACFVTPNGLPDTCRPPPPIDPAEIRSPSQDRRGKYSNRGGGGGGGRNRGSGFFLKGRPQWRPDYTSDHARDASRGRGPPNFDKVRPQSMTGINSDISSPDLGVDLDVCSDPFSSLERSNNNSNGGCVSIPDRTRGIF